MDKGVQNRRAALVEIDFELVQIRVLAILGLPRLHIFIDFGQLCSSKPTTHVHGNRTVVFMISATRFHPGQHT
jgi:hypothetical protein